MKLIIFTAFLGCTAQAAAVAPLPAHLDSGQPGCWKRIRGGALTTTELNALPKPCAEMRTDYFLSIEAAKQDSPKFEKKLIQVLKQSKKAKAPYEAIFFATLLHTDDLKKALAERSATEKKLKVPFAYATVALYRLGGKDCDADKTYQHEFYREICTGEDSILPTFFNGSKK